MTALIHRERKDKELECYQMSLEPVVIDWNDGTTTPFLNKDGTPIIWDFL